MKVLIVNPPGAGDMKCVREGRCEQRLSSFQYLMVPISLPSTAAVLREGGHDVALIDCIADDVTLPTLLDHVADEQPELLLVNVSTVTFAGDAEVGREIKAAFPNTHLSAIGVHVSTRPDEALETRAWDSVIRREPEATALVLADALAADAPLSVVDGLSFRHSGGIVHNPDRPFIEDLDALPFPARDLLHNEKYLAPASDKTQTLVITGRGCPHACIYCTAHCYYGSRVRTRSAVGIVDEMEECVRDHGVQVITMWADTFTMDRGQVVAVCDEIERRGLVVEWMCNSRVDTVDPELLRRMARAGCTTMSYGVESGVQSILDTIRKGTTLEQVRDALRWTREAGIESAAHVIFGLPGESPATIATTERFVREIAPDYVQFYCAVPFPGTRFWQMAQDNGWLSTRDWSSFEINQAVVSTPTLSAEGLAEARRRAYRRFYLRPRYVAGKLAAAGSPGAAAALARRGLDFMRDWVGAR